MDENLSLSLFIYIPSFQVAHVDVKEPLLIGENWDNNPGVEPFVFKRVDQHAVDKVVSMRKVLNLM